MMEHEIKCWTEKFARVQSGQKRFEIRKNDRDYQVGDILVIREFNQPRGEYCDYSAPIRAKVVYIDSFEQKDGYVVLGIQMEGKTDE